MKTTRIIRSFVLFILFIFPVAIGFAGVPFASQFSGWILIQQAESMPKPIGDQVGMFSKSDVFDFEKHIASAKTNLRTCVSQLDCLHYVDQLRSSIQSFQRKAVPFPTKSKLIDAIDQANQLKLTNDASFVSLVREALAAKENNLANQTTVDAITTRLNQAIQSTIQNEKTIGPSGTLQSWIQTEQGIFYAAGNKPSQLDVLAWSDYQKTLKDAALWSQSAHLPSEWTQKQNELEKAKAFLLKTKKPLANRAGLEAAIAIAKATSPRHIVLHQLIHQAERLYAFPEATEEEIKQMISDVMRVRNESTSSLDPSEGMPIVQWSTGKDHWLLRLKDGSVWSYGENQEGQLGDETRLTRHSAKAIFQGATWVGAGHQVSALLDQKGAVWMWGKGISDFPKVVSNETKITNVWFSNHEQWRLIAMDEAGNLFGLGKNTNGQLGIGTYESTTQFKPISGVSNIKSVAFGDAHTVLLTATGELWSAGSNASGQLGNGATFGHHRFISLKTPTMRAIHASSHATYAISNDGSAYVWGYLSDVCLGEPASRVVPEPKRLAGIQGITDVASNGEQTVWMGMNQLFSCGFNEKGELGLGYASPKEFMRLVSETGIQAVLIREDVRFVKKNGIWYVNGSNASGGLLIRSEQMSSSPLEWKGPDIQNVSLIGDSWWILDTSNRLWRWNSKSPYLQLFSLFSSHKSPITQTRLFVSNQVLETEVFVRAQDEWTEKGFSLKDSFLYPKFKEISWLHPVEPIQISLGDLVRNRNAKSYPIPSSGDWHVDAKGALQPGKPWETYRLYVQSEQPVLIWFQEKGREWTTKPMVLSASSYKGYWVWETRSREGQIAFQLRNLSGQSLTDVEDARISGGSYTIRDGQIYEMNPDQDLIRINYRTDDGLPRFVHEKRSDGSWKDTEMKTSEWDGYATHQWIVPKGSTVTFAIYDQQKQWDNQQGQNYTVDSGEWWLNLDDVMP